MTSVRCPMPECRRRVDLDAPETQPAARPADACLHFIAAWDGRSGGRGRMAEAVLAGLEGNRELLIRNLNPHDVDPARIEEVRPALEAIARRFGHVVESEAEGDSAHAEPRSDPAHPGPVEGPAALFGDRHEANHIAREYAHHLIGEDPMLNARAHRGEP